MWNYCAFSRFATELAVAWHCYSLELHLEPGWVFLNGFFFPFFFYLFIYFNHPRLFFFFYFITIPLILQTMYLTVCKMEERRKKKKNPPGWEDCGKPVPESHIPLPVQIFFLVASWRTPSLPIGGSGLLGIKVRWIIFFFPPQFVWYFINSMGQERGWRVGRAGEEGGEKERVLLQVLYLEITQGEKSCSLTWVVSKSSWVLLLLLLFFFSFFPKGRG